MQKYKIVKAIGDGSFGLVFKAIDPNNSIVAIKKMKSKYKSWEECSILKQIKCLKKLDHPYIIKLREVILANSELFLVFEFMETNLYQVYTRAKESNRSLTENEIKSIFYKIANGLAYLHRNGFFHRDLKPENILCYNNEIKICDFGLARQIRSRPPFTQYVATRWYRAPELLLHGAYNSPVDIFALACIIIELYLMAPLFPGQTEIQTMNRIVQLLGTPKKSDWAEGYKLASTINYNFPECKKKDLAQLIPNASLQAVDLLESMLSYSYRKRPSANEILKHEYFNSINETDQKVEDEKYQTKFSFYEKNIIDIPTNVPIEHNKEMQMRKSQIKFGASQFTSSFHLSKQQKQQKKRKQTEVQTTPNIAEKKSNWTNKFHVSNQEDEIKKKFDEMEEILMDLQLKKDKEERMLKEDHRKSRWEKREDKKEQRKLESEQAYMSLTEEPKMPVFTFGGIGINSYGGINSLKGLKQPCGSRSLQGKML